MLRIFGPLSRNLLRLRNDSLNAPAPSMGTFAEIT